MFKLVCVRLSSATASNSPIYTDTVNVVFNSTENDNNVNVEGIGIGLTASLSTLNLNNGDFTLQTERGDVSTGQINNEWVLYSPDKDMDVEMDLYGGKVVIMLLIMVLVLEVEKVDIQELDLQ